MSDIDKSLVIIQKTNDGNDLSPGHLYMVECAVNGFLTETGKEAFNELYEQVDAGTYTKPWLYGVEHLTQDHEGYVYWKGQHVEHYSFRNHEEGRQAALELAERCKHLESIGAKISVTTAVWRWEEEYAPEVRQAA